MLHSNIRWAYSRIHGKSLIYTICVDKQVSQGIVSDKKMENIYLRPSGSTRSSVSKAMDKVRAVWFIQPDISYFLARGDQYVVQQQCGSGHFKDSG
jgi:hypothetical protein